MANDKGVSDIDSVKPILFASEMQVYYGVGNFMKNAFSIGKKLKAE
jgi:hypothetical protein